jgi:mobilization protein MobC
LDENKKDNVMKKAKIVRSRWFTLRLNEDEEKQLNHLYSRTTANSLSEYARGVLLKEPITVFYRIQSSDEFLSELILLKNELNAIGINFNQAVHKLNTLDYVHQIKTWVIVNESNKKILMKKVGEIKEKMYQIYEQSPKK